MAETDVTPPIIPTPSFASPGPKIRDIRRADIAAALRAGIADFRAAPLYGLSFGAVYAFGGLFLVWITLDLGLGYLTYPFATGFALIGPFVAVGCYEVSRRREQDVALDPRGIFGVIFRQSGRELGWMAFVTLFVFILWMYQVRVLLILCLGFKNVATVAEFARLVTTTPEGWLFLALVHVDGLVFALVTFSLTVVSFPLLLDREVDFITAMIASVRSVTRNPATMISWALVVVAALAVAVIPAFLGLLVVLPVLGHATWHLYRRLVEPPSA